MREGGSGQFNLAVGGLAVRRLDAFRRNESGSDNWVEQTRKTFEQTYLSGFLESGTFLGAVDDGSGLSDQTKGISLPLFSSVRRKVVLTCARSNWFGRSCST